MLLRLCRLQGAEWKVAIGDYLVEGVGLEVFGVVGRTEAFDGITVEQLGEEGLGIVIDELWVSECGVQDAVEHDVAVLGVEGRQAREHLIQQCAERPPVDSLAIAFFEKHFRGDVFRCAAEGIRALGRLSDAALAQAKVSDLHIAQVVQQHILRLQVATPQLSEMEMKGVEWGTGR